MLADVGYDGQVMTTPYNISQTSMANGSRRLHEVSLLGYPFFGILTPYHRPFDLQIPCSHQSASRVQDGKEGKHLYSIQPLPCLLYEGACRPPQAITQVCRELNQALRDRLHRHEMGVRFLFSIADGVSSSDRWEMGDQ